MPRARTKLLCTTLLVSGLAVGMAPFAPLMFAPAAQAQQRVTVREEFRVALEPHGRFERHERFGEVWRPNRVARDWRPYTVGRWVYTDDWGWYWNADQSESDWGWVAFHYGRWVDDRQMGWVWVPGDEWGPAWVNWRRGEGPAVAARGGRGGGGNADVRYIGWSPLPPEDVIVEYRDNPQVWTFVRARDIVAPRINTVIIRERRPELLQQTVVVNRTIVVRDRGVIVNPGISPTYVAAFVGRPIVTYDVRPRVIAGTARVNNAIEFRVDDLRDRRRLQEQRTVIRETRTRIEPVRDIPAPQELRANEQGRLGDRPPRAAAEGGLDQRQDRTTGQRDQRGPGTQPGVRPGQAPGEQPSTTTQQQRDLAPGQRGSTPGQAGTAPGRAGDTPGQTGAQPPGRAGTAPGQQGSTPGQAGTAAGRQDRSTTERSDSDRSGRDRGQSERSTSDSKTRSTTTTGSSTAPGRSGAAPGRTQETPGQAQTAPGRERSTPGQSGAQPPGQAGTSPGRAGDTPGQSGAAPGRQQERGAQQSEERNKQQRGAQQRESVRSPSRSPSGRRSARANRADAAKRPGATPSRGGDSDRGAQQRQQQRPIVPSGQRRSANAKRSRRSP